MIAHTLKNRHVEPLEEDHNDCELFIYISHARRLCDQCLGVLKRVISVRSPDPTIVDSVSAIITFVVYFSSIKITTCAKVVTYLDMRIVFWSSLSLIESTRNCELIIIDTELLIKK